MFESDYESDEEILIRESDNESDSTELSDDDTDSEDEDVHPFREFVEINIKNPPPSPPRFPYMKTAGVNLQFPDDSEETIIRYFEFFWNTEILDLITTETNRYAAQCSSGILRRFSRLKDWKPTDNGEILLLFVLHILQGIINKPLSEWYWSKKDMIETPFFAKIMSYRRFVLLKRCMHFTDNSTYNAETHSNPKLNKLWPIIEHLNKKFSIAITLESDVTIDESLMLYKGRLGWIQYIPLKRARFGIKSYMLCESKSGYIWSFIIYTGKGTILDNNYEDHGIGTQVVMSLMKPILNLGHCLTTDNFYTSPILADILLQNKTDIFGTMRLNRKDVPSDLQKKKLKKGELMAYQRGKVCVMKWKDKKDVALLSTIHNTEIIVVDRRKESKTIPKVVHDYKNSMGGVDRVDQHLTNYPVIKKRGKKYYYKMFLHLLDQTIWNSFVIYTKQGGSKTHLQFRLDLAQLIIEKYGQNQQQPSGRPSVTPSPVRLIARHFIEAIPPTANKNRPTRQCKVCCSRKNESGKRIRKETRYYCPDCDVGLCIECFKIYHTKSTY